MVRVVADPVAVKVKSVFGIGNLFSAERIDFFKIFFADFICIHTKGAHGRLGKSGSEFFKIRAENFFHSV